MSVGVVTGNYDLLRSRISGGGVESLAGRAGLGLGWDGDGLGMAQGWDGWDDVSGGGCGSGGLDGLGGQG